MEWVNDVEEAVTALCGKSVKSPNFNIVVSTILVAKGIVTVEELKELEIHFNQK